MELAIIITLDIVPIPIFCFNGNQKINILILTKNVAKPTLIFDLIAIPSANTVQGVTPKEDTINKASPKPNKHNPNNK